MVRTGKAWAVIGLAVVAASAAGCGSSGPTAAPTVAETPGGAVHTWSDYRTAGGAPGPMVAAYRTIGVTCRLQGFKVSDGNTWWYRIGQAPWDGRYYGSADAFYNNGHTSGSLRNTPYFDPKVPVCTT